jgi:ferredoxin
VPIVTVHKGGQTFTGEVKDNTNLVVRAGIRQFPYPNFKYKCGMGKCATCTSLILKGGEHLPAPNWKEKKLLGDRLEKGFRLACQIWISHDIELTQEFEAAVAAEPVADAPPLKVVEPAPPAIEQTATG